MEGYKFTAQKTVWQGENGYMVSQIREENNENVASQFVRQDIYNRYCELAGVKPVITG